VKKAIWQCSEGERKCGRVGDCVCLQERRKKEVGRSGHGYVQNSGGEVATGERFGSTVARARDDTGEGLRWRQE
jgi:hypothetical protein